MPRNFGLHSRDGFWNDKPMERTPIWPFVLFGLAVAVIAAVGLFIR